MDMASGAQKRRLSIAVVGLGSIGGGAAGSLAAAGRHEILACTRQPIARFTLERAEGTIELPLPVLTDPAQAKPVDWVLLCTKTHQTKAAASWLARLCAELGVGVKFTVAATLARRANAIRIFVTLIVSIPRSRLAPARCSCNTASC